MSAQFSAGHKALRWLVAFTAGLVLAFYTFHSITDPEPRLQRAREESAVFAARDLLQAYVADGTAVEVVDPLQTNRKVGKVYIYPTDDGWEVSGHYRRGPGDTWHAFLVRLDERQQLVSLSVRDADARLQARAAADPRFSAVP